MNSTHTSGCGVSAVTSYLEATRAKVLQLSEYVLYYVMLCMTLSNSKSQVRLDFQLQNMLCKANFST